MGRMLDKKALKKITLFRLKIFCIIIWSKFWLKEYIIFK